MERKQGQAEHQRVGKVVLTGGEGVGVTAGGGMGGASNVTSPARSSSTTQAVTSARLLLIAVCHALSREGIAGSLSAISWPMRSCLKAEALGGRSDGCMLIPLWIA